MHARAGAVLAAALVVLAVLLGGSAPAGAAPAAPRVAFHLGDPRLDELSGLAAGIRSPGVVYAQNDSGDSARFFALSATSGAVLAQYDVPGATNVDWEDLAVAPDAAGTPSVWIADTGDNEHTRTSVVLYRVDEPAVPTSGRDAVATTSHPDVWRLRYPDGPADAEALAVTPTGRPYLITKTIDGIAAVYAVPVQPDAAHVRPLQRVATIRFTLTGTPGPFAPFGELTATGAAVSRDGSVVVVRTYTDAYLWRIGPAGLPAALHARPTRVALPRQPQGEGICIDRGRLMIDSEGTGTAVYALPMPALPPSGRAPGASVTARPSRPPVHTEPPARPVADSHSTGRPDASLYLLAAIAGVAILALAGAALARRRHG